MNLLKNIASLVLRIGADPNDSEDLRLRKRLQVASMVLVLPGAIIWGVVYWLVGARTAGSLPLAYSALTVLDLAIFSVTRRHRVFSFIQQLMTLLTPWLLMLALGGFINSSAVVLWALLSPMGALVFNGPRSALRWFAAYLVLLVGSVFIQPLVHLSPTLPTWLVTAFFVLNVGTTAAVIFSRLYYYVTRLEHVNQELTRLASFPELDPADSAVAGSGAFVVTEDGSSLTPSRNVAEGTKNRLPVTARLKSSSRS